MRSVKFYFAICRNILQHHVVAFSEQRPLTMKKFLILVMLFSFNMACRHVPPGHDPNGPGNSENAPGHNKQDKNNNDKHGGGSGNSANSPGQQKKHGY